MFNSTAGANIKTMAKSNKTQKPEPVRDFSKAKFDIEFLLNRMEQQGTGFKDNNVESPDETNSEVLYRLLDEMKDFYTAVEDERDGAQNERDEHKKELDSAKEEFDYMEQATRMVQFVDTSLGQLKYQTDNLIDAQIMEAFAECLVLVRPADMLKNLDTIKQFKIVF